MRRRIERHEYDCAGASACQGPLPRRSAALQDTPGFQMRRIITMIVNTTGDLKMPGLKLIVPLMFLVTTGWAGDQFLGSWKLNVAKSDFASNPKAQSGSTTYEAGSGGYM